MAGERESGGLCFIYRHQVDPGKIRVFGPGWKEKDRDYLPLSLLYGVARAKWSREDDPQGHDGTYPSLKRGAFCVEGKR